MFVWFFSHSRISHSYGDITITGEGFSNFDLCSVLMAIEQWGFYSVPHLLWHGASVYMVISEDPWHSYLLPRLSSGAVTTCFNDLGLSRLGFEHPTFRLWGERSKSQCHRRGHPNLTFIHVLYAAIIPKVDIDRPHPSWQQWCNNTLKYSYLDVPEWCKGPSVN